MALKQVLERLRLDQVDVARALPVSRITVGNWVHKRAVPQGANLAALLKYLQGYDATITLADLLDEAPDLAEKAAEV